MFISIGSIIIDDIVMPDGTTHMGCLGGGGVHAVMGMRVWSEQVGLVANIGRDFPSSLMDKLEKAFDVQGLVKCDMSTIRAWQLFETNGTRREVLRTDLNEFKELKNSIVDKDNKIEALTETTIEMILIEMETLSDSLNDADRLLDDIGNRKQFDDITKNEKNIGLNAAYKVSISYLEDAATNAKQIKPVLREIKMNLKTINGSIGSNRIPEISLIRMISILIAGSTTLKVVARTVDVAL